MSLRQKQDSATYIRSDISSITCQEVSSVCHNQGMFVDSIRGKMKGEQPWIFARQGNYTTEGFGTLA